MGFDHSAPLWQAARYSFPVAGRYTYLNHAAVAPLCLPAARAMERLSQDCLMHGAVHYEEWMASYTGFRRAAARLIGAEAGEIAIVKNTSEGIATVALGMDWKAGDQVVVFREEFPANLYPWQKLEARGVGLRWLSVYDPPERIEEAARGAKALAISFVNYLSGYRVDVERIGDICRRNGVFFFLDAIQGLGAFPLDVRRAGIHALAADGHKWLVGPEGCGLLYIQRAWQDRIEPVEFGWTNVAKFADYSSRDMTLRSDAGRYECGTLNTIGCFGLQASMEFLLEVGVERIAPAVLELAGRLAEGAQAKGYELACPRTEESGSGIVSIRREGLDSRQLVSLLRERDIIAAPRQGWARLSPHFYVSPEQIERTIDALPS